MHISLREQNQYLSTTAEKIKDRDYISNTFFSITQAIMLVILLPIYTFLILYYRDLIRRFLYAVFRKEHSERVALVIKQSKSMINSYMTGLLIEMAIVAVCNSVGLMLLGIKYALFFAVLAASIEHHTLYRNVYRNIVHRFSNHDNLYQYKRYFLGNRCNVWDSHPRR